MGPRLTRPGAALLLLAAALVTTAPQVRGQENDRLIVGDLSASLKGFATRSPRQMETLYRLLLTNTPSAYLARMPGERDVVQLMPRERVGIFSNAAAYKGQTTPLAETISRATRSYPAVTIVTDAMESDNRYLELQQSVDKLADAGWGVWVLLLPLPFDGRYDLEQPLNAQEQQAAMEECVRLANKEWAVTINEEARRSIHFTGERPLLVFVLDRNVEEGRKYVLRVFDAVTNNFRSASPEAVELSPLYLQEYAVGQGEGLTSLGVTMLDEGQGARKIVADPKEGGSRKELLMPINWKHAPARIEQPFREEWVLERTKQAPWGEVGIVDGPNGSAGALNLSANASLTWLEWLRGLFSSSGPIQREDPYQFNISSTLEKPVAGWWDEWSEETSWRCPHKVFKLKSLVERISGTAQERILSHPPTETYTVRLQIGAS